jgi:hypothetical protein
MGFNRRIINGEGGDWSDDGMLSGGSRLKVSLWLGIQYPVIPCAAGDLLSIHVFQQSDGVLAAHVE